MNTWNEAGALCDIAIEGIRQLGGLDNSLGDKPWRAPLAALEALESLLDAGIGPSERGSCADLEFAAAESKGPPAFEGHPRSMPRPAWRRAASLLGPASAAKLGLVRFAAIALGFARGKTASPHPSRVDVGGKLLLIMQQGGRSLTDFDSPTAESTSFADRLMALHGRWCEAVGLVAEADWSRGVECRGDDIHLGLFRPEDPKGPYPAWRRRLLSACCDGLERFGRLPIPPEPSLSPSSLSPFHPEWTRFDQRLQSSRINASFRPWWIWNAQFPWVGGAGDAFEHDFEKFADWAGPSPLDARLGGRAAAIAAMVLKREGPCRELSEIVDGQSRWIALLEARELRFELGPLPAPGKPTDAPLTIDQEASAEPKPKPRRRKGRAL